MGKKSNRGQITLFILAGIIFLLIAGIIFYIISKNTEIEGETEVNERKSIVYDQQQMELAKYVQSCLDPIALTALEIVRLQGGYIELPPDVPSIQVMDYQTHQYVETIGTKKSVLFDPTGTKTNTVPYWLTPEGELIIPDIEKEIETYIDKELYECVGDLKPFVDQGFTPTKNPVMTNVTFGDQVIIEVKFPIKMVRQETDYTIEDFIFIVPINWALIQEMAISVAVNDFLTAMIDQKVVEVINHYGTVSEDAIPPISRTILSSDCDQVTWTKDEIETRLIDLIGSNWYHLHVNNTRFERVIRTDPVQQGFFDNFILGFWETKAPLLSVDFRYDPSWDFSFDIFPSQGSSIKPDYTRTTNPFTGVFCHIDYNFYYDVQFPTLVKIKDLESASINPNAKVFYPYEGYEFSFPLDTKVCGNHVRTCHNVTWKYNYTLDDFPKDTLNLTYFCELYNRKSKNITLNLKDLYTGDPVDDVMVDYQCGNSFDTCFIGETNGSGSLKERYPSCMNGNLILTKKGHKTTSVPLTVHGEPERTIDIEYEPEKQMNISLSMIDAKRYIQHIYDSSKTGAPDYSTSALSRAFINEQAIIRIQDPIGFSRTLSYPAGTKMNITSGQYKKSIIITGPITAVPSVITLRGTSTPITLSLTSDNSPYQGEYQIYMESDNDFLLPSIKDKNNITFKALVSYYAVNTLTASDILDPIITADGNLSAEFLETYKIEGYTGSYPFYAICNESVLVSRQVSGRRFLEYTGDWFTRCQKVIDYDVPASVISPYLQPEIN